MSAQYDAIAVDYQATKTSPLRRYVEAYTLFGLLGDIAGLRLLDLACGEGFYTRALARAGATGVHGVDISAAMIALAEEAEQAEPLGIRYHCCDVADMPDLGRFDVVAAAYLLHYAPTVAALRAMAQRIAAHLAPGGRFVAINENPLQPFERHAGYTRYGFNKQGQRPQVDGARIQYSMISGRRMMHFDVYHFDRATYEAALRDAGFSCIEWHPLKLDPQGERECGADYFAEYLDNPPICGLVCTR